MERRQGKDEFGEYEEIIVKWVPEVGYVEVGRDDPEFVEFQKQQFALNRSRKKRKKK